MKPIFHIMLFSFSFACSSALLAQPGEQKQSDPSPRGDRPIDRFPGPPGYGPRPGGGFERVFSILTEEQRASFRQIMDKNREAVRNLEQKSAQARRELLEAALIDKFDETRVREKLNALTAIDVDLTMLRIKALSKMEPALTAEQLQKLRNSSQPDGAGASE